MWGLKLTTIDHEDVGRNNFFLQSYLAMRFRIGLVAFFLPWALIGIDVWLIDDQRQIRGSMSAYYHSPARDVFVGGLIATGGFLVSYMRGKRKTYDYWLSTFAGWALVVVAFFPTGRALDTADFKVSKDSCRLFQGPPACNRLQETFHERTVEIIHVTAATVFVVLLAALCVVFALREFGYGPSAKRLCKSEAPGVKKVFTALRNHGGKTWRRHLKTWWRYLWRGDLGQVEVTQMAEPAVVTESGVATEPEVVAALVDLSDVAQPEPKLSAEQVEATRSLRRVRRVVLYLAMCILIVAAGIWAKVGVEVSLPITGTELGETYLGEVVAFLAFGVAWLVSGKDLESVKRAGQLIQGTVQAVAGAPGRARRKLG